MENSAIAPPRMDVPLRETQEFAALLAASEQIEGYAVQRRTIDGIRLQHRSLQSLRLEGCRFTGCRLDSSHLTDVLLRDCDLSNCDLSGAECYHTRLAGLDLRDCRTDGLRITPPTCPELHGVRLTPLQALEFVRLLGIRTDE